MWSKIFESTEKEVLDFFLKFIEVYFLKIVFHIRSSVRRVHFLFTETKESEKIATKEIENSATMVKKV